MQAPKRIWWARPRKLCALERPGGGGRSHRPERREAELAYLRSSGVRLVISTMATRHNLEDYARAGFDWLHVPVSSTTDWGAALDELLPVLRRELRVRGAVALHGNRHTDFVAAVAAAHIHTERGADLAASLRSAGESGLKVTPEACELLGLDARAVPVAA